MVSIIIPNYNGKHFLIDCLASLDHYAGENSEVIVVDNGSTDGSVSFMEEHHPSVKVIALPENTGFSYAVNRGIEASSADYVYLLNNDTVVTEHFLEPLLETIQQSEKIFSVNSLMLDSKENDLIEGIGDGFTLFGWPYRKKYRTSFDGVKSEERVFSACAGATLYSKRILDEIGLFDENFFAYLEDVDLGFRANILGYENWVNTDSVIFHHMHGTSGKGKNEFKARLSAQNTILVLYKNLQLFHHLIFFPFIMLGLVVRIVHYSLLGLGKPYLLGLGDGINKTRMVVREANHYQFKTFFYVLWHMISDTGLYFLNRLSRK